MRKIEKKTEYFTKDETKEPNRNWYTNLDQQIGSSESESSTGENSNFYLPVLGANEDVFSELPNEIYSNTRVRSFVNILKRVISETDLENVTLSRLRANLDESGITIEWIFNYFRTYFSFDNNGDDSYGMVENNTESGVFNNFFKILRENEYEEVVHSVIDYIIMMGGFK